MSPCQINFPSFWDRIMTLGTFICKRVTYLCPFLTMCTGPKVASTWANKVPFISSNFGPVCSKPLSFNAPLAIVYSAGIWQLPLYSYVRFIIIELQNPTNDKLYKVQKRRSTELEALELWNVQSATTHCFVLDFKFSNCVQDERKEKRHKSVRFCCNNHLSNI